ncbi:unnamed protein product [Porites lobata]|uniref:Conodipine-M alpha chain n=1 Tax=Porites lobata TaxID=104759 RepID=A0ABN8P0Z6_9CNID|nr:unnamed protein product [Porites lobata]
MADIAMRIASLCAVLSLLVVLFSTTEVNSCYVKTNGCSIPGNLPFFYKRTFKPACDKHDVCYYCGRHYRWKRDQCDEAFKDDMKKVCGRFRGPKNWACKGFADVYYGAVRVGGALFFKSPTQSWCKNTCAKNRGDPNKTL